MCVRFLFYFQSNGTHTKNDTQELEKCEMFEIMRTEEPTFRWTIFFLNVRKKIPTSPFVSWGKKN